MKHEFTKHNGNHRRNLANNIKKGKAKAIPLQAWTGPEGSRKFRIPDF
jgi:hypothetical protein